MIMLIKMAFRNIWRNSRRSILAITSVAIAIMAVVVLQGLVSGVMDNIVKNSTKSDTGHIRISTREYVERIEQMPVHYLVRNPEDILRIVSEIPEVKHNIVLSTERIKFPVLIEFGGRNKVGLCISGDIEKEKELLMLHKSIVEGRYLSGSVIEENGLKYREVIIGKKMADVLGIRVGDTFPLMLQGSDLGIRIPRFKVVGIFNTGINLLDDNVFMLSIEDAKEVLGTGGGVQEIIIMLKDYNSARWVAEKINQKLSSYVEYNNVIALDWRRAGGIAGIFDQVLGIFTIIYLIIVALGTLVIISIMTMVILERRREIGILKAMGFSKPRILALFTLEGTMLGAFGTILGVVLGVLISIPLSIYGIDFSSSMGSMNIPMDNVIKWLITVGGILNAIVVGILVSSIVSLIPSRHAANMNPAEAIKT